MGFTTYWIAPGGPTTLEGREWLPLPATEYGFYPMVNSWTYPKPLDSNRLQAAVAKALQIYPLNAAELALHPRSGEWQLQLKNRPIPLSVGTSRFPGPFAADWKGEKHRDYYEELTRCGADMALNAAQPLTKILVTTYEATGQTSIMLTQTYNLGDGFAVVGFLKAISNYYQGLEPDFIPTFEKYLMPEPRIPLQASYTDELKNISWLAASFSDQRHEERAEEMLGTTSRLEVDFPAGFVDYIKEQTLKSTGMKRLSSGDAFAGYLASVLCEVMDPAPKYLSQCVGYRNQSIESNGSKYPIPTTSLGLCYIIQTFEAASEKDQSAGSMAKLYHSSRKTLSDDAYLSRVYALYQHLYKVATHSGHTPFDSGHADAVAINNVMKLKLTDIDFGFHGQCGLIEWEVLENFVQFQETYPKKRADGSYKQVPGEVTLVTRLKHHNVPKVLQKLQADVRAFSGDQIVSRVLKGNPEPIRANL